MSVVKADDSIILTSEQELTSNIKKIEYNIVAQKPRTLESFKSQLGTTHGFFVRVYYRFFILRQEG